MSLEDRKAALRREIELADVERERRVAGASRALEKLSNLPDLDELVNGTVAALGVTYGRSRPYVVIGYKVNERWYLTGERSPNKVTSDELADWLTSGGRNLVTFSVLAEVEAITVEVASVSAVDLGGLLAGIRGDAESMLRRSRSTFGGYPTFGREG